MLALCDVLPAFYKSFLLCLSQPLASAPVYGYTAVVCKPGGLITIGIKA